MTNTNFRKPWFQWHLTVITIGYAMNVAYQTRSFNCPTTMLLWDYLYLQFLENMIYLEWWKWREWFWKERTLPIKSYIYTIRKWEKWKWSMCVCVCVYIYIYIYIYIVDTIKIISTKDIGLKSKDLEFV